MLPEGEAQSPEAFRHMLEARLPAFGLLLAAPVLDKFANFLAALDLARRRTNLTGPLTGGELVLHALESAFGEHLIVPRARVVDVGSGAGFPGLPLAIARPDISVTPVEPRRLRRDFLKSVCSQVSIENVAPPVKTVASLPAGLAEVVVSRAVAQIDRLVRPCPFLKEDGLFLAWTTDPQGLSERLGRGFQLERQIPVPASRQKVIAAFRKTAVPRGTSVS